MKKLKFLLIGRDETSFDDLQRALAHGGHHSVSQVSIPEQVYEAVSASKIDAVIVDEAVKGSTGLEFIHELVRFNPFVNCALVSSLYPEEFHEATEGYGVFMQLPVRPGQEEARELCAHLDKIC